MTNRERLIMAWEIFRDSNPYEICDGREFRAIREPEYCMGQMIEDTLELLKEQENAKPEWSQGKAYCGKCGQKLPRKSKDKEINYCCYCGQAVKWE